MPVLIVTGGNNGIGFYMVKQWLEDGKKAAVLDLTCDNLAALKAQYGDALLCVTCDVTDAAAVQQVVEQVDAKFGRVDIAVHNACLCLFKGFAAHSAGDYNRVWDVNVHGALNLTRAVLPIMEREKSGKVCYTSSGVGVTGFVDISAYASSKGALEALAKCMNLEYAARGISFHILHPPLTDTKSSSPLPVPREFKASPEKVGRGLAKRLGSKRFMITPSFADALSVKMSYLFPIAMGKLLAKMTARADSAPR